MLIHQVVPNDWNKESSERFPPLLKPHLCSIRDTHTDSYRAFCPYSACKVSLGAVQEKKKKNQTAVLVRRELMTNYKHTLDIRHRQELQDSKTVIRNGWKLDGDEEN